MSYHATMLEHFTSTLTSKSQTVIPKEVRARMGLKPGDSVRYIIKDHAVQIEKVVSEGVDPFASFCEWQSQADARAFDHLAPKKR